MCCFTLLKAVMGNKDKTERRYKRSSREQSKIEKHMKACCPYAILDIPEEAKMSDIKRARNKKLKMHHPDKLKYASTRVKENSEELSKLINRAYEELSNKRMHA